MCVLADDGRRNTRRLVFLVFWGQVQPRKVGVGMPKPYQMA